MTKFGCIVATGILDAGGRYARASFLAPLRTPRHGVCGVRPRAEVGAGVHTPAAPRSPRSWLQLQGFNADAAKPAHHVFTGTLWIHGTPPPSIVRTRAEGGHPHRACTAQRAPPGSGIR